MIKLFLSNRASVVLILPFIIEVFHLLNYSSGNLMSTETINLGFYGVVQANMILTSTLSLVFVFINCFLINYLFNHNDFFERNTFIPSLVYVLLMSGYHSFYSIDGLLISHTFLLLCLYQLFRLKQNEDGRSAVFNAAFFAGMSATFHPPLLIILPFLFIMIWALRPFIMRESILLITGFGLPLIFGGVYLTWLDSSIDLRLLKQATDYQSQKMLFVFIVILYLLIIAISAYGLQVKLQKSSIRLKKLIRILLVYALLAFIFGINDYLFFDQIERFSFLLIPLSFFLTFAFLKKSLVPISSILLYCVVAYSVLKFFI